MLVDKEIKERFSEIFMTEFNPEQLGCVSYDVTVDNIVFEEDGFLLNWYRLAPGRSVMVETKEEFKVPPDMLITVGDRNSWIRKGIHVIGPKYFPGHHSKGYFRVINMGCDEFVIGRGMKIAQFFFEKLDTVPELLYQERETDYFSDETEYRVVK